MPESAQTSPVIPPARPALALPPRPVHRRGLWALPLLLSLVFVIAMLAWLSRNEQAERDDQRTELISDSLSMQQQVTTRIEREAALLKTFSASLDSRHLSTDAFAGAAEVQQGLRRFWVALTWLDGSNRIVAHVPEQSPRPDLPSLAGAGLSAHLLAPLASGGALVARYSPSDMLRQSVPWWLARKYDVRLVDSFGGVMASTTDDRDPGDRPTQRISLEPTLTDGYLELIARDRVTPWYRSIPMAMVAGFLALIVMSTVLLRRQVRDVSRAEAAWRTEAAWRSAMEDSLTVGLRARDLNGRIVYVNRALADMVGYAPEALQGLLPPMPYWPADSIEASMQRHRRNMAGDAPRGGYETRWQHRDGHALDVIMFEAPLVDAGGQHIGWMGSVIDITERKRLEDGERRQTETLAHHARLTMMGEIASTLAHELNQPLSAISSYTAGVMNSLQHADLAGATTGHVTDPNVLTALQRLGEQAAHAGRIVQRIREFLTRREPTLEACNLNAVVSDAIRLLKRELDARHVQITLNLEPQLPELVADAVLLEQVVINLVRNASDALSERRTQLQPQPQGQRRIDVRTVSAADKRTVRVAVTDNGPGLQGRKVEALCAAFFSTKSDGMGMGLAICRSILEAHQGHLEAGDGAQQGAWFAFTLPVNLTLSAQSADEFEPAELIA